MSTDFPWECTHTCPRCAPWTVDAPQLSRWSHEVYSEREWRDCPGEDRVLCSACEGVMTQSCSRCGHSIADHWRGFDARLILVTPCEEAPCARCGCPAELDEVGAADSTARKCA